MAVGCWMIVYFGNTTSSTLFKERKGQNNIMLVTIMFTAVAWLREQSKYFLLHVNFSVYLGIICMTRQTKSNLFEEMSGEPCI